MPGNPFDSLIDHAPVPVAIFDERFRFIKVNGAMAKCHQVTSEAHVGKTVDEVLPGLAALIQPLLSQVLATGKRRGSNHRRVSVVFRRRSPFVGGVFSSGTSRIAFMVIDAAMHETEEALQRQLEWTLTELQRSALINEMNHCLQAAMVTEEALYRIVGRFAPRLFPRHSGALYVTNSCAKCD